VPLDTLVSNFRDNLPSQSLGWRKTPKTEHNYNQEQHNSSRKLPTYEETKHSETPAWFRGLLCHPVRKCIRGQF